jgi:hypothetical protein
LLQQSTQNLKSKVPPLSKRLLGGDSSGVISIKKSKVSFDNKDIEFDNNSTHNNKFPEPSPKIMTCQGSSAFKAAPWWWPRVASVEIGDPNKDIEFDNNPTQFNVCPHCQLRDAVG